MIIQKLKIQNFRNLKSLSFNPNPSLNFFIGTNGQGKTSILEAIGYLSTLKSFRGAKNDLLVKEFESFSEISCDLISHDPDHLWQTELKVTFDAREERLKRRAWINDRSYASSTKYLEKKLKSNEFAQAMGVHAIAFNPSDHGLVQGEPKGRRKYLNQLLSGQSQNYLHHLKRFEKTLEQRNAYLKSLEGRQRPDTHFLNGITHQLAEEASALTYERLNLLEKLNLIHPEMMRKIAPDQQSLFIGYYSSWVSFKQNSFSKNKELESIHFSGQGCLPSIKELVLDFKKATESFSNAEIQLGRTLIGPQRDDWGLWVGKNEPAHSLKAFGSQGEVRSALLALKLSEIQLYREATKLRPILLLDDFSSELDDQRRRHLLQLLEETDLQVFVTSTEVLSESLVDIGQRSRKKRSSRWNVVNGCIESEKNSEKVLSEYDGPAPKHSAEFQL